jgi:hypothetical protein
MTERFPPRDRSRRRLAAGLLALLILAPGARAQEGRPGAAGAALDIRVVAAEGGEPIPGAALSITLAMYGKPESVRRETREADGQGRCRLPMSGQSWDFVSISARQDGHIPARLHWGDGQRSADLPASCTFRLRPGTTIGGVVRDERGRPVAAARVYPNLRVRRRGDGPEEIALDEGEDFAETDDHGRWRCTKIPAELGEGDYLMFRLVHPDYVSDMEMQYSRTLPIEELRAGTGAFVLRDGIPLEGRVVDSKGRPVPGASVALGLGDRAPSAGNIRTKADAEGRFRFAHVEPGRSRLFVEADGFAPGHPSVAVGPGGEPPEVRLATLAEEREFWRKRYEDYRRWLDEREERDRQEINAWRRWVMLGVLAISALGLTISWAWGRLRDRASPTPVTERPRARPAG